jgi:hypothetical protein
MTAIDERQAESARRSAQDAQQRARIRELEDKFKRYRQASENALSQLDWCIGYMHGCGKRGVGAIARAQPLVHSHPPA